MLWSLLKSSLAEVYRRCPECDALDPVFRNKDGRTASLRTDSSQSYNPTLAAFLNTQPIPASPAASPHNTAPVGRRAHRQSTSPSPTASELEDREEEMIDVEARMQTPALNVSALGELNTLSISDRIQSALLRGE